MDNPNYIKRFQQHRRGAKTRGIGFELTFSQWLAIWGDRIDQVGTRRGQYVMCRMNDMGPYAVGNCYIATGTHNLSVRGYMETRTNAKYLADDDRAPKSLRCDPLEALLDAEEEQLAA